MLPAHTPVPSLLVHCFLQACAEPHSWQGGAGFALKDEGQKTPSRGRASKPHGTGGGLKVSRARRVMASLGSCHFTLGANGATRGLRPLPLRRETWTR